MPGYPPPAAPELPAAAVLLVLLPASSFSTPAAGPGFSASDLEALQRRLGAAVQVMQINEAAFPAVVHSFAPEQLPTCVLLHQGVELWRQPGMPTPDGVAALDLVLLQAGIS
ncbi:hypothetical protein [Hymenobacter sp. APR13]|uniref:hypothetical protein n=1 Tax=Hymenobacter sp. APR13 TaxID=1356852 RepID=UPI0004E07E7D|nr:hypothetical protein [Hymenobacter sp. APR13]AII53921.1 hypothetical protein N008_18295 [Hymenobacter sp. APR13]